MRKEHRKISVPTTIVRMKKYLLPMTVLIFSLFSFLGSASAMKFDLGADTSIDCDVMLSYGLGVRASDRAKNKLTEINTDDADRNFDQWDLINNKVGALADIEIKHKDFGVFVRPKAFYDTVYMGHNANNSPDTNNAFVGGLMNASNDWAEDVEEVHGRNAEILDLFGYYNGNLLDHNFTLRVGKQVISWGESLLLQGGISSAQNPMDTAAAVAAGMEVKEILLPTEAVFTQLGITKSFSLAGYYQWRWEKSRLMEGGTFFSQGDFLDEIKAPMLASFGGYTLAFPRAKDEEARDSGQYGVAVRYVLPWLSATEVGLYFINYHDKNPLVVMDLATLQYHLKFTEDIKLYGASVSSMIGEANVSGEFSYRQDVGFSSSDALGLPAVEMGDYWQAQVSSLYVLPLQFFADQLTVTGEVGCGQSVHRRSDDFAWMFSGRFQFDWIQVLQKVDTGLILAISDTPEGPNQLSGRESDVAASIGFQCVYDFNLKAVVTYENRFDQNPWSDRDTIVLTLSYSF